MTKAELAALNQIKPLVAEMVEQKLLEMLGDPDEGLTIRPAARRRILERIDRSKTVPAAQAAARLGLKW